MNDITVTDEQPNKDMMMLKVIESGNIDALEKFISLREREESRQAAIEFDAHFSEMQAEFPSVARSKKGYGYNYVPLEDLQETYGPIIARHGFSYTFSEEALDGGSKRVTMRISGHGAERSNSFDLPPLPGTKQMNPIQAAGAASSYGRRYAFISGFAVTISDEDTDGAPDRDPAAYSAAVELLRTAKDLDGLMTEWKHLYAQYSGDTYAMKILTAAKDKRKGELSGTANG